jgi:hypothetical protein
MPGRASLRVATLFFWRFQLVSVGVPGECCGRIHMQTRQRPVQRVRNVHDDAGDRR